jgi:uncharacterized protein Usg
MKFFGEYSNGLRYTSIKIIYRMPDYQNILQEFWWQTVDIPPKYPRMKRFVDYWNDYIEAVILSLEVGHMDRFGALSYTNVTNWFKLK